jgi:hypothetical protein
MKHRSKRFLSMAARFFAFMGCDNLKHPLEKPKKQCRMKTPPIRPLWTQIRSCAHTTTVIHYAHRRGSDSRLFLVQNSSKFSLNSDRASGIIYLYLCACLQVLSSRADMPIHEMRTVVLRFFTERGLTAMRNKPTLAQHSTAQHRLTALFLRPAAARRMELNTTFVMDNRRILTG